MRGLHCKRNETCLLVVGLLVATAGCSELGPTEEASPSGSGGDLVPAVSSSRTTAKTARSLAQTVITFSEFPEFTNISNHYQAQGILFGGTTPFIVRDTDSPTSPVLSGNPKFFGHITGQFVTPGTTTPIALSGFSLDAGFFNQIGSTQLSYFDLSGALIGSQFNTMMGIENLVVSAPGVASWRIEITSQEDFGFAIDNVSFGSCSTMFDQPTGDAILDNPSIQQAFLDAIQKSGAFDGTPRNSRLEEAGYIHMRASDGQLYANPVSSPQIQTGCEVTPGPPNPLDPLDTPVAIYHTHPYTPLSPAPSCDHTGSPRYNPQRTGGGSGADWANFVDIPGGLPMFVIDKQYVWRNNPGTPIQQRRNSPRHSWNPSLCGL